MEAPSFAPFTPAGAVADATAHLGGLGETLWAARTPAELVGTLEELETLRARLAAVEACVLAEIEGQRIARTHLGWGSTGDWFTHLAGTHRAQGHRQVRHASQLLALPATLSALGEGAISPEQAGVIVEAIDRLPQTRALRDRAEAFLLEEAGRLTATDLAKAARHLLHVADPEQDERDAEQALDRADRAAHLGRFLSITEDGAGGVRLKGRGTLEDAATLKAALLPLTAPAPATDADTCEEASDPRDHGARLWDALITTAQHALSTDLAPDAHGARPRVTVTTSLEVIRGLFQGHQDGQDGGQIDWATLDTSAVTLGGVTDDGLELSPSTIRRLACDADLIPVALGTRGEVLDVGRTRRLATPALWRALVCRDQHCAFPGCTRPPIMCHAHHIIHWANGGATLLANLVMLCGYHHRVIHHTPWEVRLNPDDGRPEFRPPPRPGRAREWIRHRPRRQ